MKNAKLKVLGIQVPIGEFEEYCDDGFVSSISKHEAKLRKKYGIKNYNLDLEKKKPIVGKCISYKNNNWIWQHIFYLDVDDPIFNLSIRAHEETHALEKFNGLDLLSDKILDEQGVKINLKEIDEKEVRAHLGSIYVLVNKSKLKNIMWLGNLKKNFKTAIEIYEQSMDSKFFLD